MGRKNYSNFFFAHYYPEQKNEDIDPAEHIYLNNKTGERGNVWAAIITHHRVTKSPSNVPHSRMASQNNV